MAFPKVTEWSEKTYNAGAKGFNFLVDFEKEMWRVFPETREFNFGKFSDSDINNVMIEGWRYLRGDMFGIENIDDWNSKVGLRFSLTRDASDHVMYGGEYVMIMPVEFRRTVILPQRMDAIKRQEQTATDAAAYVHPEDPERNRMLDRAKELSEETSSTKRVKASKTSGPSLPGQPSGNPEGDIW